MLYSGGSDPIAGDFLHTDPDSNRDVADSRCHGVCQGLCSHYLPVENRRCSLRDVSQEHSDEVLPQNGGLSWLERVRWGYRSR